MRVAHASKGGDEGGSCSVVLAGDEHHRVHPRSGSLLQLSRLRPQPEGLRHTGIEPRARAISPAGDVRAMPGHFHRGAGNRGRGRGRGRVGGGGLVGAGGAAVAGGGAGAGPDLGRRDPRRTSLSEVLPGNAEGPTPPAGPQPVGRLIAGASAFARVSLTGWV